ncbi:MAG TPA: ATP-binding protein [Gaiellaceae bacterium]|nr:ATP-binding protein [Gaiellaceae bacterium]
MSSGTEPLAGTAENLDDTVRRLVVERSHDLVTLCDLTGTIVYTSPSWSSLGWEPSALAGVSVLELIHPDDRGVATAAWDRVVSGPDVDAVTLRLRRPSGAYVWFEVNGSAVRGDDGELHFMLGTARGVGEREELRSRLRDLDAVYRFADAVAGAGALDQVLDAALDALIEATGAERASVLLCDDEGVMRFRAWRRLSDAYRDFTEGHSPWALDDEDPQPVLVEDVATAGFEPELEAAVRKEGIAALAFIPLVRRERLLGKFMLYRDAPHSWSDREIMLARTIANHLASVTERTQAQQALQDSREQLATILRTVEEGITVTTADRRLLFANAASARQFGKASVDDLLAEPPGDWEAHFELFDALGRQLSSDDLPARTAFSDGVDSSLVIRRRDRKTGEERWLAVRANPVFGSEGVVELVVNVVRDITDEVLAEQQRGHSEEQLRFLARASELLGTSLAWEQTLAAIADLAVPSLAGYLVIDLLDENDELHWVVAVHADPAKTELVRELRIKYPPSLPTHPIQVALRTGETQLLPDLQSAVDAMAHDSKHGRAIREIANTSGLVAPLIARGRTLGVISLGTVGAQPRFDESDREMATELARRISVALDNARLFAEAQERAHAAEALEYVADGVFLVDELGIVRLWNPTAAISLRRPAAEAVGRPVAELLPDWPSLRARIPVASDPQAGGSRPETLPVEVDGDECWLSISAVRFPGGTVYAFRDVTDERAVEQMKTDFVSTVSHELRTPLAAIYGAAMTLRRRDVSVDEPQRDRLLEVISSESDRLARIVNDILWASRLESGRMQVAIERCDAAAIAAEVADVARARMTAESALVLNAPQGLPPVAADPDKLRQILTNLLDNAVKYSPDGGRVELEVARSGGRVRFRVADEGLGIPPAEQDRIFEKFFRLDPNLTRGVGGTGLGLYISRELVTRMNGRIWVVSDGRTGSSFFLELPIA